MTDRIGFLRPQFGHNIDTGKTCRDAVPLQSYATWQDPTRDGRVTN